MAVMSVRLRHKMAGWSMQKQGVFYSHSAAISYKNTFRGHRIASEGV